jgi:hypothetical protein
VLRSSRQPGHTAASRRTVTVAISPHACHAYRATPIFWARDEMKQESLAINEHIVDQE